MFAIPNRIRCRVRDVGLAVLICAAALTDAAAAGRICTSADTFMFGNREIGSTSTASATVSNCGDAPWSFTDVSVHPATGPAFHVTSTCTTGMTLAPGAACNVDVRFAPTSPGQTSGGLWLHNSTSTPDQLITFYGRGVDAQSGSASLTFAPASAIFGAQTVGSQSAPLHIELRNQGPAALTLSAIVLNGPGAYDFDYGIDGTCGVGGRIPAGTACIVSLVFRPQVAGTRRANLVIDSPQLSSLAIMQVSGLAEAAPPVMRPAANYSGMWTPPDESGWGINFTHQDDVIFASWFTYDASGKPYWVSATLQQQSDGGFTGAIDLTNGPPYTTEPFDSTRVTHATVGSVRLTFIDATHATFSYTLNGISQVKALRLFTFASPVPTCTFDGALPASQADNYQDMWYEPAESGWGINFTHQGDILFASWFLYDANGNPTWLSAALAKDGARTYSGALDATTGPAFSAVPFDSSRITHTTVGTASVTFADGATATLSYTLNGVSRTKTLTRIVFRTPGTVCQ